MNKNNYRQVNQKNSSGIRVAVYEYQASIVNKIKRMITIVEGKHMELTKKIKWKINNYFNNRANVNDICIIYP